MGVVGRRRPDFLVVGAPKAGTTALHAALARHPGLYLSAVKEPKYYLCDGRPPRLDRQRGPGDAHSAQEWMWRQSDYGALFADVPPGRLCGESTPFYLWDRAAHRRIRRDAPDVRLIAVLRDPVDRAYSNWQHLWSDGLEPIADFVTACNAEDERGRRGYAPFWRYRGLGRYGEQLAHLLELFDPSQLHVIRYRDLVDDPDATLGGICRFLGVDAGISTESRPENSRPLAPDDVVTRALAQTVRNGAALGALLPPAWWRTASKPLVWALHQRGADRPELTVGQRRAVLAPLVDDIALLSDVLGRSFDDWLGDAGAGAFHSMRPAVSA